MTKDSEPMAKVIQIDAKKVESHLSAMVRGSVEDTLNALLDAEADQLLGAKKYERTEARKGTRAGSYERKFMTKAGEVTLRVPKLRQLKFETAIIERYQRRESSVEEALIEMYLAGVSTRRVQDITEALWGKKVSPQTVSELNKKVYVQIEAWRNRPIQERFVYVYLDGVYLKRSWAGEVRNVAILAAIGVSADGYREVLGVCEGGKEDKTSWLAFLRHLKERGLNTPKLITSDACLGLVEAIGEVFPQSQWQRCIVHFYRNVITKVPKHRSAEVVSMLKAIHAQENAKEATLKAKRVIAQLKDMKLPNAAKTIDEGIQDTLSFYSFPQPHWRRIRTNNPLERLMREIRRRTNVVGCFPDGNSALMLAAARLRHVAGSKWGTRRYLDMELFNQLEHSNLKNAS